MRTIGDSEIIVAHHHGYTHGRSAAEAEAEAGMGDTLRVIDAQRVAMIQVQMRESDGRHRVGGTRAKARSGLS